MKKPSFRVIVQLSILIIVVVLALVHQFYGIEKAAPVDAYCPFGAIESFFTLIFKGEFLKRIFTSTFILFGIFFVSSLFLGRVFCGYFCPLGAIQEWMRALGKRLGLKNDIEINEKVDKILRFGKYIVLVVIVYFSFYLGDLIFRHYDPYTSLLHFGTEFEEKFIGYIILIIILIISLFTKSLWCRYFCPLGGFFGILKRFSLFKIKRDKKSCVSCGICNKNCPAGIKIKEQIIIKDADCISCGKCIGNCSKKSLTYNVCNKKVSKKNYTYLVIGLVIVPLLIAPLTPFWKTKPESNIVNSRGEINTSDIRGSNTLKYVIESTKIPFSEFKNELGLPNDVDKTMKLKLIGSTYKLKNSAGKVLETSDFRKVIDEYFNNGK